MRIFLQTLRTIDSIHFLTTQSRLLTTQKKRPFLNRVGNGENASNLHILLFPRRFPPFPEQISIFQTCLFCRLQMLSI